VRRDFVFSDEDTECLNARGLVWETLIEGGTKWLIVRAFPVPAGYNVRTADVALRIPPSYPDVQIDMAYFFPALSLVSGKSIKQIQQIVTIEAKQYQQWSRHRTSANPWRLGLDNVCTHLLQVTTWLEREIGVRP
jgi:hypothetical protein